MLSLLYALASPASISSCGVYNYQPIDRSLDISINIPSNERYSIYVIFPKHENYYINGYLSRPIYKNIRQLKITECDLDLIVFQVVKIDVISCTHLDFILNPTQPSYTFNPDTLQDNNAPCIVFSSQEMVKYRVYTDSRADNYDLLHIFNEYDMSDTDRLTLRSSSNIQPEYNQKGLILQFRLDDNTNVPNLEAGTYITTTNSLTTEYYYVDSFNKSFSNSRFVAMENDRIELGSHFIHSADYNKAFIVNQNVYVVFLGGFSSSSQAQCGSYTRGLYDTGTTAISFLNQGSVSIRSSGCRYVAFYNSSDIRCNEVITAIGNLGNYRLNPIDNNYYCIYAAFYNGSSSITSYKTARMKQYYVYGSETYNNARLFKPSFYQIYTYSTDTEKWDFTFSDYDTTVKKLIENGGKVDAYVMTKDRSPYNLNSDVNTRWTPVPSPTGRPSHGSKTGIIIGVVIGWVVIFFGISIGCFIYKHQKKQKKINQSSSSSSSSNKPKPTQNPSHPQQPSYPSPQNYPQQQQPGYPSPYQQPGYPSPQNYPQQQQPNYPPPYQQPGYPSPPNYPPPPMYQAPVYTPPDQKDANYLNPYQ